MANPLIDSQVASLLLIVSSLVAWMTHGPKTTCQVVDATHTSDLLRLSFQLRPHMEKIHGRELNMRRSRRRSKPVSVFGALLIEVGTVVAIIAIAQPTWTSGLLEQLAPQHSTASALPTPSTVRSSEMPASDRGPEVNALGSGQLGGADSRSSAVNSPTRAVERVAWLVPPPGRSPFADGLAAPQTPLEPAPAVYPPPMNLSYAPVWGGSY